MSGFELHAASMRPKAAKPVTLMSRRNQLNPMRSFVLLAVTWAAGSLLFAAEQPSRPVPAAAPAPTVAADVPEPDPNEAAAASSPSAQAEPAEPPAQVDAEEQAADDPASSSVMQGEEQGQPPEKAEADKTQRASAADKGSPKRFVPSEQVRADFDVSFPIDI